MCPDLVEIRLRIVEKSNGDDKKIIIVFAFFPKPAFGVKEHPAHRLPGFDSTFLIQLFYTWTCSDNYKSSGR